MMRSLILLEAGFSSENLSLAGNVLLRGLGTVFLVLVILWIIIALFGAAGRAAGRKKTRGTDLPENPEVPEDPAEPARDEGELVAAITAAIEAYRAEQGLAGRPYRVVSFRKRTGKNRRGTED